MGSINYLEDKLLMSLDGRFSPKGGHLEILADTRPVACPCLCFPSPMHPAHALWSSGA